MSPREQVQTQIYEFLENNQDRFDAPYGIIEGLQPMGSGKIRTITFGVARYLDACAWIWSPQRISIKGQGDLAYKYVGEYGSVEEVLEVLSK